MAGAGVDTPDVFTERGVAMLSGVLRTERAIAVNIEIMWAFVELRRAANSYAIIEKRLEEIERDLGNHDEQLNQIFKTLRQLISPPTRPRRPIGFRPPRTRNRNAAVKHPNPLADLMVQIPSG